MTYLLAIGVWAILLFAGIGLLVLSEPLWAREPARVRGRARSRSPGRRCLDA